MLTPDLVTRMLTVMQYHSPKEACGFVVGHKGFDAVISCTNYAIHPETEFWMSPQDLEQIRMLYPFVAIWHSHPTGRWHLSGPDRRLMIQVGLPMFVAAVQPFPSVSGYDLKDGEIVLAVRYDQEGKEVAR